MDIRNSDIRYGKDKEEKYKPVFEKFFKCELVTQSKYSTFDFIGDKIAIELKSRRIKKDAYELTMIGKNKIAKGMRYLSKGYKVYLFFDFMDGLYYYELKKDSEIIISNGGRSDRGCTEMGYYCFIPVTDLQSINQIEV